MTLKNTLRFLFIASLVIGSVNATSVWADNLETKVATLFDKVPLNASAQDLSEATSLQQAPTGTVKIVAARNSFASFNLLLSAKGADVNSVDVHLDSLNDESGKKIRNATPYTKDNLFVFTDKPIELFYVKYLEIKGLSKISYESNYDERHVPKKFRRPFSGQGAATGGWKDRRDSNKLYPDILVPLVLQQNFNIKSGNTQSIIGDIFIAKDTAPGIYKGTINVTVAGKDIRQIPIEISVRPTTLGDTAQAKTMVYLETADIAERYLGERYPSGPGQTAALRTIIDNHFKVAHRHGITLFDKSSDGVPAGTNKPSADWIPRLSGELYSKSRGYDGPAIGTGSDLFVIGAYGSWEGKDSPEQLRNSVIGWDKWFKSNFPDTELLFYVADESDNYPQLEQWSSTVSASSKIVKPFITMPLPKAISKVPSASVVASWFNFGITKEWADAKARSDADGRQLVLYNGRRPLSGTFATEDDGIALRTLPWIQLKFGVPRWFFWDSTYYTNFQGGTGKTDVFKTANTFGAAGTFNATNGDQGWNYSNGDGVLMYPGTEKIFPEESYGVNGPLVSLRMKIWRAGIEDSKYLELALRKDNASASNIVHKMVPKALWEVGVSDASDPTWNKADISWSTNPADWDKARSDLLEIIEK